MKNILLILAVLTSCLASPSNLGLLHPIGDSLTDGAGCTPGEGGYRHPLDRYLTSAGISHQWAGTLQTWTPGSWPEGLHDGHGGWTTQDLIDGRPGQGNVGDWVASQQSDTVLLMVGRNDPWDWPDRVFSKVYQSYWTLIELIYQQRPNATIYWSNVFLAADAYTGHCDMQDAAIRAVIADQRLFFNRRLFLVDNYHYLGFRTDIFSDGVHLNDLGYTLVAKNFLRIISKTAQASNGSTAVSPGGWLPWP